MSLQTSGGKTNTVPLTIMACSVLHNICIDVGDPSPIDINEDEDGTEQNSFNRDVPQVAADIRDNILYYLSA